VAATTSTTRQAHAKAALKRFLVYERDDGISLSAACGVSCRARAERAARLHYMWKFAPVTCVTLVPPFHE
jgi:hypothetical protein